MNFENAVACLLLCQSKQFLWNLGNLRRSDYNAMPRVIFVQINSWSVKYLNIIYTCSKVIFPSCFKIFIYLLQCIIFSATVLQYSVCLVHFLILHSICCWEFCLCVVKKKTFVYNCPCSLYICIKKHYFSLSNHVICSVLIDMVLIWVKGFRLAKLSQWEYLISRAKII